MSYLASMRIVRVSNAHNVQQPGVEFSVFRSAQSRLCGTVAHG